MSQHIARLRDDVRSDTPPAGADRLAFMGRLQTILTHWPSADRLARSMGVSPSAFRKWLKGEAEPSRERLVALARAAGVGVAWLAEGEGPAPVFEAVAGSRRRPRPEAPVPLDPDQFVLLPKHPEAAAAGAEPPPAPAIAGFFALRHDWVRSVCRTAPDDLLLEIAAGDSMLPRIRDGDTLLVDTTERSVRTFGVYVLEIDGQRLVKRVQRKHDGSLVLISDNPAYLPDPVGKSEAATVTVIGRVVWAGGPI
nr:helix-turn-helix transcriptional regulator [uncultured Rhodopila sp.]